MQAGWTQALDLQLILAAGRLRSESLTNLMVSISALGAGEIEIPLALLLSLRLSMIRRHSEAAGYAAATLSGWALYGVAKWAFQRPRPRIIPRLSESGWFSFPSGHATMAPLVFGLGVLFWADASWSAEIAQLMVPFHRNRLLASLERNRLANYLQVLEWQSAQG